MKNIKSLQKNSDADLLHHVIDYCEQDIFATLMDGTLVFANRLFRKHHALGETQSLEGINICQLEPRPETEKHWRMMMQKLEEADGKQAKFSLSHPLPDSPHILAYEGYIFKVTDDDGVETMWAFGRDISERIRHEQEIKRYTQVLDKVMESLPAGIVVKDINDGFKYIYRNKESFNRDIPILDSAGRDDFDFHPMEQARIKREQDIKLAQTGETIHWIAEEKDRKGNPLYLDKRKMRVEVEGLSPVVLSIEWNITEMEKMKRSLAQAKEKAEKADLLKSAFLANMSHEIRTPLNAIVGFSQVMAETDNAEERAAYYAIVQENSDHLLELINEILDLSKIEAGVYKFNIKPQKLHTECQKVYNMMYLRCPECVELRYEESGEQDYQELEVMVDSSRLVQVISNLIGNAYKFTTRGHVAFGFQRSKEEEGMIEIHVTDTGAGIPADKVPTIFDRFVKANEKVAGTGLGLSICKAIVEHMGGHIQVETQQGVGTTFTFTVPAVK